MTATPRDRGAVDVSVQMLFGLVVALFALLLVFEAAAYWHARNVFDDAASEGARVAAAFDGDCQSGTAAAQEMLRRHAAGWGGDAEVACVEGAIVVVTISGATPGVLGGAAGFRARVTESAPKER